MRSVKNFVGEFESSFLSCEKDTELVIKKLFVDSRPYSDELKRLMLINNKDCLDDRTNPKYKEVIENTSIADLVEQGYIRLQPRVKMKEHENMKNYIIISYDNFSPTSNIHFRDCIVELDVLCHIENWDIGNFRQRPLKIVGYIDGILNNTKLTGIGRFEFLSCKEIVLSEEIAGYCLMYRAIHAEDDLIESDE